MNLFHSSTGTRRRNSSGQALVELAVALVAVLVLVVGLVQIGSLSRAHLEVIDQARERAGRRALGEVYGSAAPPPVYLRGWAAGPDGRFHTRDDVPVRGSPAVVREHILRHGDPVALQAAVPGNPFSTAGFEDPLVSHFGLVGAREESPPVPLWPLVRQWIYRADSITLEATVWSVRLDGLE